MAVVIYLALLLTVLIRKFGLLVLILNFIDIHFTILVGGVSYKGKLLSATHSKAHLMTHLNGSHIQTSFNYTSLFFFFYFFLTFMLMDWTIRSKGRFFYGVNHVSYRWKGYLWWSDRFHELNTSRPQPDEEISSVPSPHGASGGPYSRCAWKLQCTLRTTNKPSRYTINSVWVGCEPTFGTNGLQPWST